MVAYRKPRMAKGTKRIVPGSYKMPVAKYKGLSKMNTPRPGRVGKQQPQFKKFHRG